MRRLSYCPQRALSWAGGRNGGADDGQPAALGRHRDRGLAWGLAGSILGRGPTDPVPAMQRILFEYSLNPTTWAYLSALLTLGIYFKFNRFWSVRNLDLVGLIAFSPGILLVYHGLNRDEPELVQLGYAWLFGVGAVFVVRLFLDPIMVRRPLLEPNLNASGLTFTGAALLVFLLGNILASEPPDRLEFALARSKGSGLRSPGLPLFWYLASFSESRPYQTAPGVVVTPSPRRDGGWQYPPPATQAAVARLLASVGLLALVAGIVTIGLRHFGSAYTGVAAAALYLLLPYVGQMTGRIDHLIPGALLTWAVAAYRRPMIAGILIGLAAALIFYPLFLLPLWCSFYLRRGLLRFVYGVAGALVVVVALVAATSLDWTTFAVQIKQMFGGTWVWQEGASGFWNVLPDAPITLAYRVPLAALFTVLAGSLGLWPAQKNLGTLVSCSATVMLSTQFVHTHQGGLYMAWYAPLLVLTVFRPNLEDRVAISAVIEGRSTWLVRLGAWLLRWSNRARRAS